MKKADNPLAALQAQRDAAIRKDECERVMAIYRKRATVVQKLVMKTLQATQLLEVTKASRMQIDPPARTILAQSIAPQRKVVTATPEHIGAALQVLRNTSPRYAALTAGSVAAVWEHRDCGKRLAGAALRVLVADGRATVKRGKYAQVEPPQGQPSDGATDGAG